MPIGEPIMPTGFGEKKESVSDKSGDQEKYYGVSAATKMDRASAEMREAQKKNDQISLFAARERYLAAGWEVVSQLKDETLREREGSSGYIGWGTAIDSLVEELNDLATFIDEETKKL